MKMLRAANVNAGEDLMKLSFIFKRTMNPASIKRDNPVEDINNNIGLKYKPTNEPVAPMSCK